VSGWTTIPPWLYQNDLPDEQLQEVYVRAARKKLAELRAAHWELGVQVVETEAFLAEAERALARYRHPPAGRRLPGGP
jgi:hypothetical protein